MIGVPQPPQQVARAPRPPSNIAAAPIATQSISPITPMINGVPVDFIDYFNIDIRNIDSRDSNQLSEIYKLLKNDGETDGDVLLKIGEIERKLGYPAMNETRYGRIWSYLRINSRISEMEKQKKAMEIAGGQ